MNMKKLYYLGITALFLFAFIFQASALDVAQQIEQQTGINPEKIQDLPKSPEEIKETYLKQEWSELVAKNKILAPIHSFFLKISPVFLVLFGENYSLSLILLGVIILWVYVALELTTLIKTIDMLNPWAIRGIAVGISIILAQVGVYRTIITLINKILYANELWWMRLIILVAFVVAAIILDKLTKVLEVQIKQAKINAKNKALETEIIKQKEFIRGMKSGTNILQE